MKVYVALAKWYNDEFQIIGIFDNLEKALNRSKTELKKMIEESFDPEEYDFNEEYESLVKYNETFIEDLGEFKIIEKEVC